MIGIIFARESNRYDKNVYSLKSQVEACLERAEADGVKVADKHVFREQFSGKDLAKMPKLGELRRLLSSTPGRKRVYCYAQDRLFRGRKGYHIFRLLSEFDEWETEALFILDNVDTGSFAGQIQILFKGEKAAREPDDILDRTMRGKIKRVKEGKLWGGSYEKFGYVRDKQQGNASFNEEEKALLLEIIDKIFDGESVNSIATRLTRNKIPTPRQRRSVISKKPLSGIWHPCNIITMLRDPAYKGEGLAMRYKNGAKGRSKATADLIPIPGAYPPLLAPEKWDELQARLSEISAKRARKENERRPLVFRGRLVCARCGNRMTVCARPYSVKSGETRRCLSYVCQRRDGEGRLLCKPWNQIATSHVEREGWSAVVKCFRPEALDAIAATIDVPTNADTLLRRRQALEDDLARKRSQQQNLITRLSEAGESTASAILQRLDEIGDEMKGASIQIQQIDREISTSRERVREAQAALNELSRLSSQMGDFTFSRKRRFVEMLGLRAIWDPKERTLVIDTPLFTAFKGNGLAANGLSAKTIRKVVIDQTG